MLLYWCLSKLLSVYDLLLRRSLPGGELSECVTVYYYTVLYLCHCSPALEVRLSHNIERYLWTVTWLDGRIWTEFNVLPSNLIWLGGRIWNPTAQNTMPPWDLALNESIMKRTVTKIVVKFSHIYHLPTLITYSKDQIPVFMEKLGKSW